MSDDKSQSYLAKIRAKLTNKAVMTFAVLSGAMATGAEAQNDAVLQDKKIDKNEQTIRKIPSLEKEVIFNSDTTLINRDYIQKNHSLMPAMAEYDSHTDMITTYYLRIDTTGLKITGATPEEIVAEYNNPYQRQAYKLHESQHQKTSEIVGVVKADESNLDKSLAKKKDLLGIKDYPKGCVHDEISSSLAELVFYTGNYIESGDINKIPKRFAFMRDAINENKVKPDLQNPEFLKFMAQETQKMWLDAYGKASGYEGATAGITESYARINPYAPKENKAKFATVLNEMYTINGYNFAPFINQDVPIGSMAERIISNLRKRNRTQILDDYSTEVKRLELRQGKGDKSKLNMQKEVIRTFKPGPEDFR